VCFSTVISFLLLSVGGSEIELRLIWTLVKSIRKLVGLLTNKIRTTEVVLNTDTRKVTSASTDVIDTKYPLIVGVQLRVCTEYLYCFVAIVACCCYVDIK
jgi:hypothetical protein